jgi:hypothetical protein
MPPIFYSVLVWLSVILLWLLLIPTSAKISATDGDLIYDATEYRSLAGALQYSDAS